MSAKDKYKLAKLSKKKHPVAPKDYPLHSHPLTTTVPSEDLRDLTGLAVDLIRNFIFYEDLLDIVQSHDDEKLDDYFLNLLLERGLEQPAGRRGVAVPDPRTVTC